MGGLYRVAAVTDSINDRYEYVDNMLYTSLRDAQRAIERIYLARQKREEGK
jgi:hypothetical protein